jgi:hypothetical protein
MGSIDMRMIVPPVNIAYRRLRGQTGWTDAVWREERWAHEYGVAELMPADGEELERVDDQPRAGDGPQPEKHDGIHDYLKHAS